MEEASEKHAHVLSGEPPSARNPTLVDKLRAFLLKMPPQTEVYLSFAEAKVEVCAEDVKKLKRSFENNLK